MDAPALAAKLNDSDPGVRAATAEDLAHLAEGAQSAAVPLVQAMGDADEDVRNWAYAALESLGLPRTEDVCGADQTRRRSTAGCGVLGGYAIGPIWRDECSRRSANRERVGGALDSACGNCRSTARRLGAGAIRLGGQRGQCSIDQGQLQFRSPVGAIGKRSDWAASIAAVANSNNQYATRFEQLLEQLNAPS